MWDMWGKALSITLLPTSKGRGAIPNLPQSSTGWFAADELRAPHAHSCGLQAGRGAHISTPTLADCRQWEIPPRQCQSLCGGRRRRLPSAPRSQTQTAEPASTSGALHSTTRLTKRRFLAPKLNAACLIPQETTARFHGRFGELHSPDHTQQTPNVWCTALLPHIDPTARPSDVPSAHLTPKPLHVGSGAASSAHHCTPAWRQRFPHLHLFPAQ